MPGYSSAGFGSFLSTMLQLRAQRLAEAEARAKAQEQGMSSLMSGIQSGIGGIMGGISKMGQDQTANRLGAEYFGPQGTSAEGQRWAGTPTVGGLMQADEIRNKAFTGGEDELNKRIQLEGLRDTINKGKQADLYRGLQF